MPSAWFLMPFKVFEQRPDRDTRALEINFDPVVLDAYRTDGGEMRQIECRGNHALIKLRAFTQDTLDKVAGLPGTTRITTKQLNETLSDLTPAQKTALRNLIVGLGYALADVQAALGPDIGNRTVREVLRYIVSQDQPGFTVNPDRTTFTMKGPIIDNTDLLIVDAVDAAL